MDYANRALVLRQKTRANLREFLAEAKRTGTERLPLWLAADHFPCTLGSLNNLGPRVVSLDTGGVGAMGIVTIPETAARAGIKVDFDRPGTFNRIPVHPCSPAKASLGKAMAHNIYGIAGPPEQAAAMLQVRPPRGLRRRAAARAVPCRFLGKHLRFAQQNIDEIAAASRQPPHTLPSSLYPDTGKHHGTLDSPMQTMRP